jgi:hypothetical protein
MGKSGQAGLKKPNGGDGQKTKPPTRQTQNKTRTGQGKTAKQAEGVRKKPNATPKSTKKPNTKQDAHTQTEKQTTPNTAEANKQHTQTAH